MLLTHLKRNTFNLSHVVLTTLIFSSFQTLNTKTAFADSKAKKTTSAPKKKKNIPLKAESASESDVDSAAEPEEKPSRFGNAHPPTLPSPVFPPPGFTPGFPAPGPGMPPGFNPGFGSGIGTYPAGPYAWCNQAMKVLQSAESYANMEYAYGRFDVAMKYLFEGLQQAAAMEGQFHQNRSLVAWALQRGIKLTSNLIQSLNGSLNQKRTVSLFLSNYYRFIFELATDVDAPYWVPAHQSGCFGSIGGCGFDVAAFEFEFIDYVQDEVRIVLNSLATEMPNGFIVPVGTGRAFLTTLRDTIEFAASDLMSSPFSPQYACAITTLYQTYQRLTQVLSGPLGGGHEIQEVNYNYRLVSQVIDGLSRSYGSCQPCSWKPRRFR